MKLLFTAAAVIILAILFLVVDRGDAGPSDARMWRGGANDPFRRFLLKPDGTFRQYTKVGIALWFAIVSGVVWIVL